MPQNKSRTIYFETEAFQKDVLTSILQLQGFSSILDQYSIMAEIEEGSRNKVEIGYHRVTGMQVAVKTIPLHKYERLK